MNFLLQKDMLGSIISGPDIDMEILKEKIRERRIIDTYKEITYNELLDMPACSAKRKIPVGSIKFVETWLRKCHGIERINPIEVPKFMRTEEFVKRDYRIVPFEGLPESGEYFIKDVTALKSFTYSGDVSRLFSGYYAEKMDRSHMYQVSEVVSSILSEYRVYVIGGEIVNISNYDGSPLVFPDTDVIVRANRAYMAKPDYPKSLTIDVMVTGKGTELIEIHPFVSCGLYSTMWGGDLPYAYRDGIDYVLKHNTLIEP